jgi:hypothetical protein
MFSLFRFIAAKQGRHKPTPRFFTAGIGGVATVEICVGTAA